MRYILHHTHDHSKAALFILTTTQLRARGRPGARSFRVALRSQPIDTAGSLQPLVGLGFALEPLDVADIGPRIMGLNLPVVLGDALVLEGNARFAHGRQHALVRQKPSLARLFERKISRLAQLSSTTTPSRMVTRRSICAAISRLWVATMAASPEARTNWPSVANTRSAVRTSRLPVGSSAKRMRGALATARAMATRCCSPPDSSAGRCVSRSLRPR